MHKGITYEVVEEKISPFRRIFGKKEEIEPPYEFGLVTFTEEAVLYGIFEDFTTEVRHYRGKSYISKPFHRGVIESLEDEGIPVHDVRDKQLELPILGKTNPAEVNYEAVE